MNEDVLDRDERSASAMRTSADGPKVGEAATEDWRAQDLAYFVQVLGPVVTSDGSRWTEGEWPTEEFYAAFRKRNVTSKGPIKWPGLFLEHIAGEYGSGVENWLTDQGLEASS